MNIVRREVARWLPSILVMLAIFTLSSQPQSSLPRFGWADPLIKKGGHVIGYGLLALSLRRGLGSDRRWLLPAWILSVLYGVTDEVHQAFIPGRGPSAIDVLVFDGGGAGIALWIANLRSLKGVSTS